ncbi:restriction endonuclease subunit S [Thiomicrorhabdus sp.]|uniref:restriction endonuclease subunit S n=1 Tax=Thiomicrorhabdus sp. TaxID=2039724 RepID=UPI002AA717C5|nr:restriction endonuclease subunit S [Thiomicrorhabdus sp.]
MKILISELFEYQTGNLPALELTEPGDIPLIYGTTKNNGVIKLVKIDKDSKVFKPPLITVSYLGTAFVQRTTFTTSVVDKSNITILKPRKDMPIEALYYYCMQINKIAEFGYSYGRRMNQKQLNKLYLNKYETPFPLEDIGNYLPCNVDTSLASCSFSKMREHSILELFDVSKGGGGYLESLDAGDTPLISATSYNNGVIGSVNAAPLFKKGTITIERIKSTAFVQLQDFLTVPDDIYVLTPKKKMELAELYFYCYLIRRESWKYSYGRKLTQKRLENIIFHVPLDDTENIDSNAIVKMFKKSYGNEITSSIYRRA